LSGAAVILDEDYFPSCGLGHRLGGGVLLAESPIACVYGRRLVLDDGITATLIMVGLAALYIAFHLAIFFLVGWSFSN
jgi:hypothetical protein